MTPSMPYLLSDFYSPSLIKGDTPRKSDKRLAGKPLEFLIVSTSSLQKLTNVPKKLIDELHFLANLPNDWAGIGSLPVFTKIIEKTIVFLSQMNEAIIDSISDYYPNPNGTLTMEWENLQSEKLVLEIGLANFSYFIKYNQHEPYLYDGHDILSHTEIFSKKFSEFFG